MPAVYQVTEPGARLAEAVLPPPGNDFSRLSYTMWLVGFTNAECSRLRVTGRLTEREIR